MSNNGGNSTWHILLGVLSLGFTIVGLFQNSRSTNNPNFKLFDELSAHENTWKTAIENKFDCLVLIRKPKMMIRQDSVFHIDLLCKENSPLNSDNDFHDLIDSIGKVYVSDAFVKYDHFKYILFSLKKISDENSDPGKIKRYQDDSRHFLFQIDSMKLVTESQRIIVPRFLYKDFDEFSLRPIERVLGTRFTKNSYFSDLHFHSNLPLIDSMDYKELKNCKMYRTKNPLKIPIQGAYLEAYKQFVFYENQHISTVLTYRCYPRTKKFRYENLIQKLKENSTDFASIKQREKNYTIICKDFLSRYYLNYQKRFDGVLVKVVADTSAIPWTIRYETSLDSIRFKKDLAPQYDHLIDFF